MTPQKCVILIGHGGIPSDFPTELVGEFKRLEASSKGRPSARLAGLDRKLRTWPRTPQNDPYKLGLEAVAEALRKALPDRLVLEAYNEFCSPTLEEAVERAVKEAVTGVTVITTMYTGGGVHSETEVPRLLDGLRKKHPTVSFRYAWPFDLKAVGGLLASEVRRAEAARPAPALDRRG